MLVSESLTYLPLNSIKIKVNKIGLITLSENVRYTPKIKGFEFCAEKKNNYFRDYSQCIDEKHRKLWDNVCTLKRDFDRFPNEITYYDYYVALEDFKHYHKQIEKDNGFSIPLEFIPIYNTHGDIIADIMNGIVCPNQVKGMYKEYLYKKALAENNTALIEKFEHTKDVSVNRSIASVRDYCFNNKWNFFFTSTVNSVKCDRYNYEKCVTLLKHTMKMLVKDCKRKNLEIKYIVIPEYHKDKAVHFHGLLYCNNKERFVKEYCSLINGRLNITRLFDNIGFSQVEEIRDILKSAKYVTKYIAKSIDDENSIRNLYQSTPLYYASKGLNRGFDDTLIKGYDNTCPHKNFLVDEETGEIKDINVYRTFIDLTSCNPFADVESRYNDFITAFVIEYIKNLYRSDYFEKDIKNLFSACIVG